MKQLPPLVSIIIPVYNTGKFLERCLDSVIHQTYPHLEIIIVNDGSTDNSTDIIEQFLLRDDRIKFINQSNQGLPTARRNGLLLASGKYIQHLDSDDYLVLDAIEFLVFKAEETGADIINSRYVCEFIESGEKKDSGFPRRIEDSTGFQYLKLALSCKVSWTVWSNFHKRSLYVENDIQFVPEISYGEDAIFMVQLFYYAQKVISSDKVILFYSRHINAMSYLLSDKKYKESQLFPQWIKGFLVQKGIWEDCKSAFELLETNNLLEKVYDLFNMIKLRHLDRVDILTANLIVKLKEFPSVKAMLSRRYKKFFLFYQFSPKLGWWYLKRKMKQGKF